MIFAESRFSKRWFAHPFIVIIVLTLSCVVFLVGCGVTPAFSVPGAEATSSLSPTATLATVSCTGFAASQPPISPPVSLPPGTIVGGANAVHGEGMLDLCTSATQTTIDQFMRTTLAKTGWHIYNPAHDVSYNCQGGTLGWIKGHDALNWTFKDYNGSPLSPPRWRLLTCGEVNMPPN